MATEIVRRRKIRRLEDEEKRSVKRGLAALMGSDGLWPLDAPGMPPPGPDFLHAAGALGNKRVTAADSNAASGERLRELYRRALREARFPLPVELRKGLPRVSVEIIPGHLWGQYRDEYARSLVDPYYEPPPVDGPRPAEVMLIGKMPWSEELREGRNLIGASGQTLLELLRKVHIKGVESWYITNLVKFMPPDEQTRLRSGWIADCLPLLHQELRIVRPKYILCIGADASKAVFGGMHGIAVERKAKGKQSEAEFGIGRMEGRVIECRFPVNLAAPADGQPLDYHHCLGMTVLHPAEVTREPTKARILERGLGRFSLLITGVRVDREEHGLDHRVIDTLEDAEELCAEINAYMAGWQRKDRLIGWDAEWHGQHPQNAGSYLRTVQISWDEKKAAVFKIRHQGGKLAFRDRDGKPAFKRLVRMLNDFMRGKRAVGHFFTSDLEWLNYYGLDPTRPCRVPLYAKNGKIAWQRLRDGRGWLDTAMMCHAIEETASLGLESLAMRYTTTVPRYDLPLEEWKKQYCKEHDIKPQALEGYGEVPDKILMPYAAYDSDATLRLCKSLLPLLDSDYEGNGCWEPFWESMIALRPILRIHQHGILVDRARIDDLTKKFITARAAKEDEIRTWSKWTERDDSPEFNVRSTQHVKEFLFGEALNGRPWVNDKPVCIRPPGAQSLYIVPLLDTSKPPRRWDEIVARGQEREASPTTNKQVLGILAQENLNVATQINWIRDYRFLDQVLKSILRYPKTDENDHWIENDNGELEYDAGLAASIDDDGRVRTHIYPTAETGRWRSARPNLQNVSKSRDPDYERLLGKENYQHKLRSVFKATPGYVLLEFDYKGAELYMAAINAGAKSMREHCERANTFDEEGYDIKGRKCTHGKGCKECVYPHPEYYDIHSNVAKLAFRLNCHPSKAGLKSLGKAHFRTLAKNVVFGTMYGRGAKAIALQAREQGVNVSVDDAQLVIDTLFGMYPELVTFFDEAKSRALNEKWLCNCFGRFRRFPTAGDYKLEGEFERQAMNFPIQSSVASCVDRGLAYLEDAIEQQGLQDDIRLLLQIHDAGLVECRYHLVPYAKELIKWAMCDMVEIWPTDLAGVPRGDGPYHLGLDYSIDLAWSEHVPVTAYEKLGILAKNVV